MTGFEKKNKPAMLNEDAPDGISGGVYGDLLKPIGTTYNAICTCGFQETVNGACYGKHVCPQCGQRITNYENAGSER